MASFLKSLGQRAAIGDHKLSHEGLSVVLQLSRLAGVSLGVFEHILQPVNLVLDSFHWRHVAPPP